MGSSRNKRGDDVPLMMEATKNVNSDVMVDIVPSDENDESNEQTFTKHDITLWISDAIILLVEHLQYYAILLVLSEHWGWPISWINATAFSLIFNFDIWEFRKVESGAFNHSRSSFIDTSKIGFNYMSYLASWAVILCIICSVFGGTYYRWTKRRPLYLLLLVARWKRAMFLIFQLVAVPFGVASSRIYHCRKDAANRLDVIDVQNELECYSTTHFILMVFVGVILVGLFLIYPLVLRHWIQIQVFSGDAVRHEGYLQLKEAEYEQGLDTSWDINQYHLFSSYNRFWIYYNPWKFFFKFMIIICFAISVKLPFWSSAMITILFAVAAFVSITKRPFRVKCFNFMLTCNHLVIAANTLIGNFMVRPPWEDPEKFQIVAFLRPPSISNILLVLNICWLVCFALWVFYLLLLNNGLKRNERIWPRLSYESSNKIGEDTKKYLKAALKARHILEKALAAIPLFAPVHELAHEIKVINAYCREAEVIGDPTHDTLWDLLDELIEAHNALISVSVFGMSGKSSVKETSEEFIKLMPSFRKRLKQREYDFILVSPLKRRLLLKMFVLSTFVKNKRKVRSNEKEVAMKLQEALLMFDVKSLDDSETGFGSDSASSFQPSRAQSSLAAFLADVDRTVPRPMSERSHSISSMLESSPSPSADRKINRFKDPKMSFGELVGGVHSERPTTAPLSPLLEYRPLDQDDRPVTAPASNSVVKLNYSMSSLTSVPGQVDEVDKHMAVMESRTVIDD